MSCYYYQPWNLTNSSSQNLQDKNSWRLKAEEDKACRCFFLQLIFNMEIVRIYMYIYNVYIMYIYICTLYIYKLYTCVYICTLYIYKLYTCVCIYICTLYIYTLFLHYIYIIYTLNMHFIYIVYT